MDRILRHHVLVDIPFIFENKIFIQFTEKCYRFWKRDCVDVSKKLQTGSKCGLSRLYGQELRRMKLSGLKDVQSCPLHPKCVKAAGFNIFREDRIWRLIYMADSSLLVKDLSYSTPTRIC